MRFETQSQPEYIIVDGNSLLFEKGIKKIVVEKFYSGRNEILTSK
jgi:hypothetical protein